MNDTEKAFAAAEKRYAEIFADAPTDAKAFVAADLAGFRAGFEAGRLAALEEAAGDIRAIPCWGDGKGHSGFDVGDDPVRVVRDTIDRLLRSSSPYRADQIGEQP